MLAGELNCTVECNPLLGPTLFDVAETILAAKKLSENGAKLKLAKPAVLEALKGEIFEKRILTKEGVFDQSTVKEVIKTRTEY